MKKTITNISQAFWAIILSLFILSSCNQKAPEDVLNKTKQALFEIRSGELSLKLSVVGEGASQNLNVTGQLDSKFSKPASEPSSFETSVALKGQMDAPEKKFNFDGSLNLISTQDNYYFKIDRFSSNEPSLKSLIPFLTPYQGRWYRLNEDFIPSIFRSLQPSAEDQVKQEQLKDLFLTSELFFIQEDLGTEKVNGKKAYHLRLGLNPEAFSNYLKKVSQINDNTLSSEDMASLLQSLQQISSFEIFVDQTTYHIYKGSLELYNEPRENQGKLKINLDFQGGPFNQAITIKPPASALDFNPLALPAGLPSETVQESSSVPSPLSRP